MQKLTEDYIINKQIKLLQPKIGYRVAIDPIIFASFINAEQNQKILDVGCGVGAISLVMKKMEKTLRITALDIDERMCEICEKNAKINSLNIEVINNTIENFSDRNFLRGKLFDHVVTNPPFFKANESRISELTKFSKFETLDLLDWISFCIGKLKPGGIFSIIHNASRVNDIVCALRYAGLTSIIPIFPKRHEKAKRVIVQCKRKNKSEAEILPGLIVHNDDGSYSDEVKQILAGNFPKFSNSIGVNS
jgi:tRNA1(Val) A37 N6-methylase TrmN6